MKFYRPYFFRNNADITSHNSRKQWLACLLIVSIVTAVSFFTACVSWHNLRFHEEVRSAYNRYNVEGIFSLIKATKQDNRDLVSASMYFLGKYLYDLSATKKRIVLRSVSRKDIIHEINVSLLSIYNTAGDFNLRSLSLQAIVQYRSQESIDFLSKVLQRDSVSRLEPEIVMLALKELTKYFKGNRPKLERDINYKFGSVIENVRNLLSHKNDGIFSEAISTLILYSVLQDKATKKTLEEYVTANSKTYRGYIVKRNLLLINDSANKTKIK